MVKQILSLIYVVTKNHLQNEFENEFFVFFQSMQCESNDTRP
jgi:hypothetical protein